MSLKESMILSCRKKNMESKRSKNTKTTIDQSKQKTEPDQTSTVRCFGWEKDLTNLQLIKLPTKS